MYQSKGDFYVFCFFFFSIMSILNSNAFAIQQTSQVPDSACRSMVDSALPVINEN